MLMNCGMNQSSCLDRSEIYYHNYGFHMLWTISMDFIVVHYLKQKLVVDLGVPSGIGEVLDEYSLRHATHTPTPIPRWKNC